MGWEHSGSVVECLTRPRGGRFEPHRHHCVVSLSKNINPSLVMVQPRKTSLFITERLLMGRKELSQTNLDRRKLLFQVSNQVRPNHPSQLQRLARIVQFCI